MDKQGDARGRQAQTLHPARCSARLQGACADPFTKEDTMTKQQSPRDKQEPHTGKVVNDTNKTGEQDPTQLNQGKRTPESRSDREAHVGGSNQSQSRRGSVGSGGR
jgi:hypothetical protein